MARMICELYYNKEDAPIQQARMEKDAATKKGMMAARAHKNNPKNPRYKKDLDDSTAKIRSVASKASEPMTHEKSPNIR